MMSKTDALNQMPVNSVHPGFIWTPMIENFLAAGGDPAARRRALNDLQPFGHIGEVHNIAHGILH
jgi:NAD(P)-dependent dehydrogenase (short-subunit alcohol dehydrogenase family)